MKTVNLTKVPTMMVDGSTAELDYSKELANNIYQSTRDAGEASLAMDLYKRGEVEDTEAAEKTIRKYAANFVYFAASAINRYLDSRK